VTTGTSALPERLCFELKPPMIEIIRHAGWNFRPIDG
jgi:hypothetical protein